MSHVPACLRLVASLMPLLQRHPPRSLRPHRFPMPLPRPSKKVSPSPQYHEPRPKLCRRFRHVQVWGKRSVCASHSRAMSTPPTKSLLRLAGKAKLVYSCCVRLARSNLLTFARSTGSSYYETDGSFLPWLENGCWKGNCPPQPVLTTASLPILAFPCDSLRVQRRHRRDRERPQRCLLRQALRLPVRWRRVPLLRGRARRWPRPRLLLHQADH